MKIIKEKKIDEANYKFDKERIKRLKMELNDYYYAAFHGYVADDAMASGTELNKNIFVIGTDLKKHSWV